MPDIYVMASETSLQTRIKARLLALSKNPSSVAIEAGLGRSALRDILVGKAQNPRIDTLRKLSGPLQCSLEYLTGQSEEVGTPGPSYPSGDRFEPREVHFVIPVEAGVFRTHPPARDGGSAHWENGDLEPDERYLIYSDPRLPGWSTDLYRIQDSSLSAIGIRSRDLLTVATPPPPDKIPLRSGTIVVVSWSSLLTGKSLTEVSARLVRVTDDGISLEGRPTEGAIDPILISFKDLEDFSGAYEPYEASLPNWYVVTGGTSVTILGLVVRITRDLKID